MIVGHILGLPIEETVPQLIPAAGVTLVALQVICLRPRRWFRRRR